MATYNKDFIGLNILVNDPIEGDNGAHGENTNTFGYLGSSTTYSIDASLNESKMLPILITHRNGPWGFPNWKQTRIGDNAISRHHRKNNKITFLKAPVEKIIVVDGKRTIVSFKDPTIQVFDEPAVVSKHQPLVFNLKTEFRRGGGSPISILAEYNNNITFMTNNEVNAHAGVLDKSSDEYNNISGLYLGQSLKNPSNIVKEFRSLRFKQTIFPPEEYTFKSYTRVRPNYVSGFWRDDRSNRTQTISDDGFAVRTDIKQSMWPLDVSTNWATRTDTLSSIQGFNNANSENGNFGILWNNYSFAKELGGTSISENIRLKPACYYSRRHTLVNSQSVTNPSGRTDLIPASDIPESELFGGEAAWDAPVQSGKTPFYDTVDNFYEDIRPKYKDYSIAPEYRIEDHIDFYLSNGITEERLNLFRVTGGLPSSDDSSKQNFYETYSMSDFLKNFDVIVKNHEDLVKPSTISLTCKAVKKFVPYDGFYPAQRTVKLAQTFYDSYRDNFSFAESTGPFGTTTTSDYSAQPLLQPLFAPGVLFNTIKAGVACDFLTFLSASNISNNVFVPDRLGIFTSGSTRVPFEALVDPEEFIASKQLSLAEPHTASMVTSVNTGSAFWDGQGKQNYKLMMNNFLAEVPEFFLKNKNFSKIVSQEQGNPNFGNARKGTQYGMRVKMYRSMQGGRSTLSQSLGSGQITYLPPQDVGTARESLTMYSRPSAFGPPVSETTGGSALTAVLGKYGSQNGYNFIYTPPYYHGVAFADIFFTAEESKKYSIQEIFNSSSVEYYRIYDTENTAGLSNDAANEICMQLSASINLFALADPPDEDPSLGEEESIVLDTSARRRRRRGARNETGFRSINVIENENARWAIQTKFECPILNFNSIQTSSMTMPEKGAASVPIGMWHQYGSEPSGSQGVFMQVTAIPRAWRALTKGSSQNQSTRLKEADTIKPLNKLLGFSNEPVKLGQLANSKMLEEAVIAVPFFEEDGVRKFFDIPREDIQNVLDGRDNLVGASVVDMVDKMTKYSLPPSFNFITYSDIDPFVMYIFEFKQRLSRVDLKNIWQNLSPRIGTQHVEASSTITHELLAHELMGGGAVTLSDARSGEILNEDAKGKDFNSRVRWMVFKAKRKAKNNYKAKILKNTGTTDTRITRDRQAQVDSAGAQRTISYNWPHDYYSLVELIKIDAAVEFSKIEKNSITGARSVVPITGEDL